MTVPKSKRSVSEFEFYNTAVRLREHLTLWLLRDFGVKTRPRDVSFIEKRTRMSAEDKLTLEDILERNGLGESICDTYPQWWISERRRRIDLICADILENIVRAYNLYATTSDEYRLRREWQNRAITGVYALIEEVQFVIHILFKTGETDVQRFMSFVKFCDDEIALLKGWRKQGNAQREGILRKEIASRLKIEAKMRAENPA